MSVKLLTLGLSFFCLASGFPNLFLGNFRCQKPVCDRKIARGDKKLNDRIFCIFTAAETISFKNLYIMLIEVFVEFDNSSSFV